MKPRDDGEVEFSASYQSLRIYCGEEKLASLGKLLLAEIPGNGNVVVPIRRIRWIGISTERPDPKPIPIPWYKKVAMILNFFVSIILSLIPCHRGLGGDPFNGSWRSSPDRARSLESPND